MQREKDKTKIADLKQKNKERETYRVHENAANHCLRMSASERFSQTLNQKLDF